ncbi:MAG TPA: hypothetical protein PKW80_13625 [Bacteroidales bacterium]|nr:hypothetical protein [Bacteroidales bacterium]
MKTKILSKYFILVIPLMLYIFSSCISFKKPKPIPENKKAFIGFWIAENGFKMEIKSSGTADITNNPYTGNPINDTLNIGVSPEYAKDMFVEFGGDSLLIIRKPKVRAREYRININPHMDRDTCKMVLNGILLKKQ